MKEIKCYNAMQSFEAKEIGGNVEIKSNIILFPYKAIMTKEEYKDFIEILCSKEIIIKSGDNDK